MFSKDTQRSTLLVTGMSWHGKNLENFAAKNKLEGISYSSFMRVTFARFLAKIAYGFAVERYGLDAIDDAYVIPSILGKSADVGRWVGCEDGYKSPDLLPKTKYFHLVHLLEKEKQIEAKVRLFASFSTPEYLVIVVKLK